MSCVSKRTIVQVGKEQKAAAASRADNKSLAKSCFELLLAGSMHSLNVDESELGEP